MTTKIFWNIRILQLEQTYSKTRKDSAVTQSPKVGGVVRFRASKSADGVVEVRRIDNPLKQES
jgi:hypothetical protein